MIKWIVLSIFLAVAGWLINAWVSIHALAVLTKDGYKIIETGWLSIGYIALVFIFFSFTLCILLTGGFADAIQELARNHIKKHNGEDNKKIIEEWQKIEVEKAQLSDQIKEASQEARTRAELVEEQLLNVRNNAKIKEQEATLLIKKIEQKLEVSENRYKGALERHKRQMKTVERERDEAILERDEALASL